MIRNLFIAFFLLLCTSTQAQTRLKFFLADSMAACSNAGEPRNCLLMKEKKSDSWSVFFNDIEGFKYSEGYCYKLLVEATYHDTKLPDGFNLSYKLIKQIYKKKTDYNPVKKIGNRKWVLVSLKDEKSNLIATDTNTYIFLNIAEKRMNGSSICNNMNSEFTADGTHLKFQPIRMTKKLCESSSITIEYIIKTLLEKVSEWQIIGNRLILIGSDETYMVFEMH